MNVNEEKLFSILKPDALDNFDFIDEYLCYLKKISIGEVDFYSVDNWIDISKMLYEYDVNRISNFQGKMIKREKLLTTILGYFNKYYDKKAIAMMIIPNDNMDIIISNLSKYKKMLREKYVANTNVNYITFLNFDYKLLFGKLSDIDLNFLNYYIETYDFNDTSLNDINKNMVFFNKLHTPESIEENIFDINIINSEKILNLRNKIKESEFRK